VNRELRRLSEKEEDRARKRRQGVPQKRKKERVGPRQFLREVRQELKKVAWPSRRETQTFSTAVIVSSGFVALVVFGLDIAFKEGILFLLGQS
jgi:preprotein translocase subunit SecE